MRTKLAFSIKEALSPQKQNEEHVGSRGKNGLRKMFALVHIIATSVRGTLF